MAPRRSRTTSGNGGVQDRISYSRLQSWDFYILPNRRCLLCRQRSATAIDVFRCVETGPSAIGQQVRLLYNRTQQSLPTGTCPPRYALRSASGLEPTPDDCSDPRNGLLLVCHSKVVALRTRNFYQLVFSSDSGFVRLNFFVYGCLVRNRRRCSCLTVWTCHIYGCHGGKWRRIYNKSS